ncbi:serine--tRNA ligase [Candidatus Kaiserbacteria bacterium]|nr:serine--tRNA ligase [Candidatus Kaiserbacteria bacterium]
MLDIKFIRENLELVKAGAIKKHIEVDLDALMALDEKRRELTGQLEAKKAEQNKVSQEVATADAGTRMALIERMKPLKEEIQKSEDELKDVLTEWRQVMVQVPNIPDISVPEGDSDADNAEVRTWGEKSRFGFEPKSHIELAELHDMADFERGAKVSGFRGYFLKGMGVRLNFAIWNFVFDFIQKRDPAFVPLTVPSLVRREPFIGTGYLPQGEDDLYKTQDGDFLAGTAEVGAMGYYMDEVIDRSALPIKFLGFSPCFRREAGSHGKDTKGLMRVHEFFKFEQIILCEASHERSVAFHEALLENAESIMQALKIPYHVVVNCAGDLGLGQVKKYDIEAWVPSEKTYRETHSASYFHDFQTRRLNIRYRDADGTLRFVHSLNNTAAATPRLLIPLIENNQQEDGSIKVPEALVPYMGGISIIGSAQ